MEDAWAMLLRYKIAEDKLKELKRKVWSELPMNWDIEVVLQEAEDELNELRAVVEMNSDTKRWD